MNPPTTTKIHAPIFAWMDVNRRVRTAICTRTDQSTRTRARLSPDASGTPDDGDTLSRVERLRGIVAVRDLRRLAVSISRHVIASLTRGDRVAHGGGPLMDGRIDPDERPGDL